MSKAEERANEKYPLMQEGDQEGLEALKYIGMECDSVYGFNSVRYSQQAYFIEGYHQAEKDNELTWSDMKRIIKYYQDIMAEKSRPFVRVEDYKEVLNRFKY